MADNPTVSVILPVYNGSAYLVEAIESVLDQTWTDFELLLIDDGSTDSTIELASRYDDDPRLIILRNNQNMGLIATLNRGIELARGEFIARMDADDIALPHRLERQVTFLESHPDVGLCGSHVITFWQTGEQNWRYPEHDDEIRCRLLFSAAFAHPSVMMRRTLLMENHIRYDKDYPFAEDYAFWIRCMPYCSMANIAEPLLRYRLHESNTASRHRIRQRDTVARIHRELLGWLNIVPTDDDLALHFSLAYRMSGVNQYLLDRIEDWLIRLRDANRATRAFPIEAFEHTLDFYWRKSCRSSSAPSYPKTVRYWKSTFGHPWRGHLYEGIKLFIHAARKRRDRAN